MGSQKLIVAFKRPSTDLASAATRRTGFDPLLRPTGQCGLVGGDVFAGISEVNQRPQFLFGFRKGAAKRFRITLPLYAVAQPKTVFAALVNAAVAVCAFPSPESLW